MANVINGAPSTFDPVLLSLWPDLRNVAIALAKSAIRASDRYGLRPSLGGALTRFPLLPVIPSSRAYRQFAGRVRAGHASSSIA
ncbi:hypothetical protein GCM10018952_17410 [Streptosporangium vulgare]